MGNWHWQSAAAWPFATCRIRTQDNQPKLMKDFVQLPLYLNHDLGGVHLNRHSQLSAFNIMTRMNGRKFVFTPKELAAMFYIRADPADLAPIDLRRQPARRGAGNAGRCSQTCRRRQIDIRVAAVKAGFAAAGIR